MRIGQKIVNSLPFLLRHLVGRNARPYEQILRHLTERGDVWIPSQGEYISWWLRRENAAFKVFVRDGQCFVHTSLEDAVIEKFPGEFLEAPAVFGCETAFQGEVWITVDTTIQKKELLIELLKREGILNIRVADVGQFLISQRQVGKLLDEIDSKLHGTRGRLFEDDVRALRQVVIDELSAADLPLTRVWYHPRLNGVVTRAVFSPRFDVDRAISNVAQIRALESRFGASSTLYIRAFCPFYTDEAIKTLVTNPWCSEIALHGEFVTHARSHGSEFAAAEAEKRHLESITERPILGVSTHGGELAVNKSENTDAVLRDAGFVYDTSPGPMDYYFPFRKVINGRVNTFFTFTHALSDVALLPFRPSRRVVNGKMQKSHSLSKILRALRLSSMRDHQRMFYEHTIAKFDQVYEQNGVLVMTLHPSYFGFFSYLIRPMNWGPLVKFVLGYFAQSR